VVDYSKPTSSLFCSLRCVVTLVQSIAALLFCVMQSESAVSDAVNIAIWYHRKRCKY